VRVARVPEWERIPGLVHGFEQRPALADAGPDAARARVKGALAPHGLLLLLKQVHGATVHSAPWQGRPEGDAAVSEQPGLLLGIETADCRPVLSAAPVRRVVAAAHAGWRGTAQGVAAAAVEALVRGGSRPEDLLAALGPANGACCYEVGPELQEAFGMEWDTLTRPGPRGRPHLDVRKANRRQLERAGLGAGNIVSVDDCTACRPELYYSYRREGPAGGRMISYIGWSG
jgi:YfiH family protein